MISKQQGFSLIEVLITFIILIVGIMGLIKLQTYMERQADYAENSIKALHLAESQLELFRTRSVSGANSSLSGASSTATCDDVGFMTFDCIIDGTSTSGAYTTIWTVSGSFPIPGGVALKTIEIETGWDTRWNERQSVALKTMISKYNEFDN
ncbi:MULTISPECIES: type IV pilus modification PilV family protein [Vibrio]|uniref:Pilus assembly protein PilV n=1 Tax=Vibrio casei TaxID=673372 RepID=A0A368LPF7_9VIBR|nr:MULTISPECIES: prepilin-type N-terminal cleavage/methylation domain-containing protein [Vibrio]RCS73784.1 pilus assembly protein PilV [Vibrio casei]SJN34960.1 Type IV fimbrial biogenesis protein PilV [Vibrio casei]HBV77319.1 pilus assembly protein PilV [Vibrio sp.]